MVEIGIDPVLLSVGSLSIRWYGIIVVVAAVIGLWVARRELRRRGVSDDVLWAVLPWGAIGVVVGARLLHVIDKLDYYAQQPLAALSFQDGGLAIYGAVLGGLAALLVYSRRRPLPLGDLLDAAAPGFILAQAIGRIACTINGDVPGLPANLPWSVVYTHPNTLAALPGVPVHPAATYELVWNLGVFVVLWSMRRVPLARGSLILVYLALYSVGRFFITFFRVDQVIWMGLTQAQVVSLVTIVMVIPLFWWLNRRVTHVASVSA